MKIIWIILFVLSFIGCQILLLNMLRKLDRYFDSVYDNGISLAQDDGCRQAEDVVK